MADVSEKWSCPLCNATWTRQPGETLDEWAERVGYLQAAHPPRCARLPEVSR